MTAEILKDNLHYLIIESKYFPKNPKRAIFEAFEKGNKLIKTMKNKVGNVKGHIECPLSSDETGHRIVSEDMKRKMR